MSDQRVSIDDIEGRLRSLTGGVGETIAAARPAAVTGGIVGGSVLLAIAFLFGRRRGRRRATVLEIYKS
jgi:hypothetical protein